MSNFLKWWAKCSIICTIFWTIYFLISKDPSAQVAAPYENWTLTFLFAISPLGAIQGQFILWVLKFVLFIFKAIARK
jgi:hypothetical protein